jgi:hypothetical protein
MFHSLIYQRLSPYRPSMNASSPLPYPIIKGEFNESLLYEFLLQQSNGNNNDLYK